MLAVVATFLFTAVGGLLLAKFTSGEKEVNRELPRLYALQDPQFRRTIGSLLGPPLVGGNLVQELLNGDQIFPAMLKVIRSAQHSITFETDTYWSGQIDQDFGNALSERVKAGVKVHVLLDWVGSVKIDEAFLQEMQAGGVEMHKDHKPHWYNLGRLNNRTHRKLLVVNDKTGFTGGVGIARN